MEQGRTEEDMNQQQDHQRRRLKPENPANHQQQPQKCPRCESLNTKFCYYNNYSLSQPRYFCKACRRYWTQGGTLRNVPFGGGCRKGKRTKAASSSSGENSRSQSSPPPPPPQQQIIVPPNLTNMGMMVSNNSGIPTTSQAPRNKELANFGFPLPNLPATAYYSGVMQSMSRPQAFNQPLHLGGQFSVGGASNLALLQGFNDPSFRSRQPQHHDQQIQHQSEFYQMGNQSLVQPNRPLGSWTQNFINTTNPSVPNTSFWNSSTTNTTTPGSSLNPNQWPDDLSGYGPPP